VKPKTTARNRLFETLFWGAAVAVGLFVLLPAVVELIEARRMEDTSRARSDIAGDEMLEEHNRLKWVVDDSEGVKKLAQQQRIIPTEPERTPDDLPDPAAPTQEGSETADADL
jgi:hypothetical protein